MKNKEEENLEDYFDITPASTGDDMFSRKATLLVFKEGKYEECLEIFKQNAEMQGSTIDEEYLGKYKNLPNVAFIGIAPHHQAKKGFDGTFQCISISSKVSVDSAWNVPEKKLTTIGPAQGKKLAILVAGTSSKEVFERYPDFYNKYIQS